MKALAQLRLVFALCFGTSMLAGCGQSAAPKPAAAPATKSTVPDPDDVPITEADVELPANYDDAVQRIKGYRDSIRSAVEAGSPAKAHRPLDELDIVLNKLPSIARDSGVPKDKWESVNTTAHELRDLFNQVHSAIDEKRTPDYDAVAEPIEQALGQLESVSASK